MVDAQLLAQASKIEPTDVGAYALKNGWVALNRGNNAPVYSFRHLTHPLRQIRVPKENDYDDYKVAIMDVVSRLSEIEERPQRSIIIDLLEPRADALRFRIKSPKADAGLLQFETILGFLHGAKGALLAAAHSVEHPQAYHPRLNRSEGKKLVENALFGQTEQSSFVMTIYCPLKSVDIPPVIDPLDPTEGPAPFVRRTTNLLMSSVSKLITDINSNPVNLADGSQQVLPVLSANLCDSILQMLTADDEASVTLSCHWAPLLPKSQPSIVPSTLVLRQDYITGIESARQLLLPQNPDRQAFYVGTVEELYGEPGATGRRSGEVLLSVLNEGEKTPARVTLDEAQYGIATAIHLSTNGYVKLHGTLQKGAKISRIINVSSFEAVT